MPSRRLHGWQATLSDNEAWSFQGVHTASVTSGLLDLFLPSFHRITLDAAVSRPAQSDDRTRGGRFFSTLQSSSSRVCTSFGRRTAHCARSSTGEETTSPSAGCTIPSHVS